MTNPESLSEQEQIAIIAHRIYEDEGCPVGRSEEHWARAERIVHEQRMGAASGRERVPVEASEVPPSMLP